MPAKETRWGSFNVLRDFNINAIGTPVNMDAWYKAFNVQPGDKLYKKPADRIKIW